MNSVLPPTVINFFIPPMRQNHAENRDSLNKIYHNCAGIKGGLAIPGVSSRVPGAERVKSTKNRKGQRTKMRSATKR